MTGQGIVEGRFDRGTLYAIEVKPWGEEPTVKVGWTGRDEWTALRRYTDRFHSTAAVRLMWRRSGTRLQEQILHRALAAHRTGGREWYAPIVMDLIEDRAWLDGVLGDS